MEERSSDMRLLWICGLLLKWGCSAVVGDSIGDRVSAKLTGVGIFEFEATEDLRSCFGERGAGAGPCTFVGLEDCSDDILLRKW